MALPKIETETETENENEKGDKVETKQEMKASNPGEKSGVAAMDYLKQLGFNLDDLHLDFTSFPIITLNDGIFSTPEHPKFGDAFAFMLMQKRKTYLFTGEKGRDDPTKLCYSDDGIKANTPVDDMETVAEIIEKWKKEGYKVTKNPYYLLMGKFVAGLAELEDQIVQLQIPRTSMGKFDGYLVTVAMSHRSPYSVVTSVTIGPEVGSGIKTFNPWIFRTN